MKMTITISYRPSQGSFSSVKGPLIQQKDGTWEFTNPENQKREIWQHGRDEEEDIVRCIRSINKNSRWKHDILVLIDYDVTFREGWAELQGDNVKIFKANNEWCGGVPQAQQMCALKDSALSLPDDLMLCYALNSDTVVAKNWDVSIAEAYAQYGDDHEYVPMFVEPRTKAGKANLSLGNLVANREALKKEVYETGDLTARNIWEHWRISICCHSLTMLPPVDKDYFTEADLDHYVEVANAYQHRNHLEPPGARGYGYWAPLIAKCKHFKSILPRLPIGLGGDLYMDNNMPVKFKVVVTKSFVFHLHIPCKLDEIEVEHE